MAPFSNFISLLFLTTIFLSLQINARDSKFFSKVTHVNNNNVKETELVPNNEGPLNKPEKRPVFIPETENNYGLYGHETGMHPPTTTTTTTSYEPYKTESEEVTTKFPNNNYYNKESYNTNQNEMSDTARFQGSSYSNDNINTNYYNSKDAYGSKQNELSDTKYNEGEFNSMENDQNNNNNQKYYYNNNNGANDRYSFSNNNDRYYSYNNKAVNDKYNGERQGLSDTRFMEGGKYFYDVNTEKFDPTYYGGSSRGAANSENWYNYRGYFGNNTPNSYKNKNSMEEGYQNREEVFEGDQDEFEP